ncbi:MAG TPA: cytochrome P450 [Steroidobacteraceae bacterium]|nr:cytochrome P450 [Steroidobacteraceae bacterium]
MTVHADFTSQEYFRNPTAEIEKLRAAGPVVEVRFPLVGTVWTTTTQDLANQVLRDSGTFTVRKDDGDVVGFWWWMPKIVRTIANNMLSADEPDHTRLRSIVDEAFRRQAVLEMEPRILAIAGELADGLFAEGSPSDLVDRYARKLPLAVICELLGLPLVDRPKFTAWASGFTRFTSAFGFLTVVPKIFAMKSYMEERLEAARETGGEGLIAELVRVEEEGGRISRDEMVAMLFLLLFAGHETTTHLISGSVHELLRDPGLRDWLEEDWSRANLAVEEFLRFVSPVQFSKPRFVRKDVELGGVRLKKGDKIMPMLAAGNFDPQANEHPGKLDLKRRPNRHVAFGAGIHFCLGHQLARIEGKCALRALFERWPKLELAIEDSSIRWRTRAGLRAIERLPVMAGH